MLTWHEETGLSKEDEEAISVCMYRHNLRYMGVMCLHPGKAKDRKILGHDCHPKGSGLMIEGADLKLKRFSAVC